MNKTILLFAPIFLLCSCSQGITSAPSALGSSNVWFQVNNVAMGSGLYFCVPGAEGKEPVSTEAKFRRSKSDSTKR